MSRNSFNPSASPIANTTSANQSESLASMPSLPFHSDLRRSCQVYGRLLLDQIGVVGLNETIEVERYPLMVCRHGLCVQTGNGRRFDLLQDIFRPHRLEAGG